MKKKYYVPLLHQSKISFYPFFRLGGFGLGNLLFPYFRSLCLSLKNGAILLYPNHYQFQPRNFLRERNLKSLRNYSKDFNKFSWSSINKFKSARIFYSRSFKSEKFIHEYPHIFFSGYNNYFYDLIQYRKLIQKFIIYSYGIQNFQIKNEVAFHLRLGDFIINKQYIEKEKILYALEYFTKKLYVNVKIYSGSSYNQIKSFLEINNLPNKVTLVKSISPMHDLISMSKSKYICGNPYSTFVEWARFINPESQESFSLLEKNKCKAINVTPLNWNNYL